MSLNLKKINRLKPRIIISFLFTLCVSMLTVSITIYLLLSNALRDKDHQKIIQEARLYFSTYKALGTQKILRNIGRDKLLVIENKNGKAVFKKMPSYFDGDFEDEEEREQLKKAFEKNKLSEGWHTVLFLSGEEDLDFFHRWEHRLRLIAWEKKWPNLLPLIDNDMFEIYTYRDDDGFTIHYGTSSEEREEYLSTIRRIAFFVFFPFIIFGVLMSYLLAAGILKPIQSLIDTIKRIKRNQELEQVPRSFNEDEIDILSSEFNSLVKQNYNLVSNLKNTLDTVAHDLRTPLTRFRIKAEEALLKTTDEESMREALATGIEETDEIINLLTAILDMSEASHQALKLVKNKIDLDEIFKRLSSLYEIFAEEQGVSLVFDIERKPFWIEADSIRLTQALANLIDNAIKYSSVGGRVEVRAFFDNSHTKIEVWDQGAGISPEEAPLIWNRLYRGRVASSTTKGLGIGLSLSRAILKAHGFEIELDTSYNDGAKFIITLPKCNA